MICTNQNTTGEHVYHLKLKLNLEQVQCYFKMVLRVNIWCGLRMMSFGYSGIRFSIDYHLDAFAIKIHLIPN